MSSILIYADGACRGNPGPGGWGAVILNTQTQTIHEIGGRADRTTNNRMEIQAASSALASIADSPGAVTFYLDSTYVIDGITKWVHGWQRNGWKTSTGAAVVNQDLWEALFRNVKLREKNSKISWKHILGHAGIPGNERADEIATAFADKQSIELYNGSSLNYSLDLVNIPEPDLSKKKASKNRSGKKAYIYLSLVNGVLQRHATWDECSARVKGVAKAKFKKALSSEEEKGILREWGLN